MAERHAVEAIEDANASTERRIVYVVDDNVDIRKSLHFALTSAGITVWPFGAPEDFLDALDGLTPAPILLDVRMPQIDGVQLLRMIREREIEWPVIMMTAHGDIPIAVAVMKLGALDFLEKPFAIERLEELLAAAHDKVAGVLITAEQKRVAAEAFARLSPRERQVARGLVSGSSNKAMAKELGISPRTVEIHRAAALKKLDVKCTADAVRLLIAAGEA